MSGQAEVWPPLWRGACPLWGYVPSCRPWGCVCSCGPWQLPYPSKEALELGKGGGVGALPPLPSQERCIHGWWAAAALCAGLRLSRVSPASPLCSIRHPLQGLWGQQLCKADGRLGRPVQLLGGALPRNAFGTQQWIKLSLSQPRGVLFALRSRHRDTCAAPSPFIPQA